MARPLPLVVLLPLLGGGAGCAPPPPPSIALGWSFVDGRRCTDAGASQVVASFDCPTMPACAPVTEACRLGDAAAPGAPTVMLAVPSEASVLLLQALSPSGDTLYRGSLELPGAPPADTVTLYFTGGQ
jgi:hypothetical protein